MCLLAFGGFVDIASHFGGEIPPNSNFWGVNRRFQVKRSLKVSCYLNYCIDFNQIWRNDRDHQVVIVGGPSRRPIKFKMADGRHFEKKPLNHHISATVRSILMEFSRWCKLVPGTGITVKILNFSKIHNGGGCHLEKSQKSRYLRNYFTDLYEIWYANAKWAS